MRTPGPGWAGLGCNGLHWTGAGRAGLPASANKTRCWWWPALSLCSYTVLARADGADWAPVLEDRPAGTLGYTAGSRTFEIAGLDPGRYKVVVYGLIVHPNGGDATVEVWSNPTTSSEGNQYMRNGIIGVGTPGEQVLASYIVAAGSVPLPGQHDDAMGMLHSLG